MQSFNVRVINSVGHRESLDLEGENAEKIKHELESQGLLVLSIEQQGKGYITLKKKSIKFNVIIFSHELRTLLISGLSLSETLDILNDHHGASQDTKDNPIYKIRNGLHLGLPLSEAMRSCQDIFPEILLATVAASERNGTLIKALTSYIKYDEQISVIRSKVYNASMYPLTLMVVAFGVIMFLLMYLVPRFGAIYEGIDMDLPLASELMLKFGAWLGEYRLLFVGMVSIIIFMSIYKVQKQGLEPTFMAVLSKISPLKKRLEVMYLSRFYRGLSLLLDSGASVTQAFNLSHSLLLPAQQKKLLQAKQLILEGRGLSFSLDQACLTTAVSSRLLNAGDKNGEIVAMLDKSAEFHDLDLTQFVEKVSRLLEPILMLAIGLFIGVIVVLLYMPIFGLASGLQS
ncbi:type II secretion system F family protein [Acinetobacter calcoaceticus]|uniref:type II secretion system F family protein n=1 Tax=Acinetobacter calcoaceticus TaxID=471 RepID=UPI0002CF013F|nr:type II secretion system F family protein [Acinetobacter calcoaceticus]ENU08460.1 hypothetical protein F997_01906 [Acinetobacter calcoaceticus NIPH 13]